jgi:hypothetical protein
MIIADFSKYISRKARFRHYLRYFIILSIRLTIVFSVYMLFFSPLINVSKEYRSQQKHEKPRGANISSRFYNNLLKIKAIQ